MKELITIQAALKAPKNQRNDFGKYNYRSAEDILEAVKPHLKDVGCVLTLTDGIIEVGGRVYVQATARLVNSEGAVIETQAYAREEESKKGMDASQITGSASSYARKYALNGLFCIDDTKDADATNTHGKDAQEEELKMDRVIERVNESTTYEELKALWDSFGKYDKDKSLSKAIAARRKQLGV
jgi:hypothetical protein